jgi:hypothetical protein
LAAEAMIATVLAGRDEDLSVIQVFLDQASAGRAALLLTGEPGVGKTALLDVAQERAAAAGVRRWPPPGPTSGRSTWPGSGCCTASGCVASDPPSRPARSSARR